MLNELSSNESYYNGKCAMCINYHLDDIRSAYNDGFVCDIHWLKRLALDDSCPRFKKDKNRSYKDIKKAYEKMVYKYGKYRPHKYHIVTAICEILGIDEYQLFQDIGVWYRAEYLENIDEKKDFLQEYDVIGKDIADLLYDDENCYEIAQELFITYVKPFSILVMNKQFEEADYLYMQMYNMLKADYSISVHNEYTRKKIVDND